ncbi:MAG: oligosaccharide flippase family protein [Candidatus Acidiferrales bacterium]
MARNTVWMLCGQGLRLVIQALYFVIIARSLGASGYGAFIGVVALVGMLYPFGDLGSGPLLVKNVSRDQSLFPAYWGTAIITTAVSSSVLFLAVLALSRFALPATIPVRLVLLVSGSDLIGLNFIAACWQAFQAFDRLNWTAAITVLISASRLTAALVLVGIQRHPTPLQWGYAYFFSTAVVAVIAIALVLAKLGPPRFRWQRRPGEVREGFYFSAGLSAQTIYNDLDKTMLARLGTLEATGIYGAAYRLIDVSFVPVSSLLTASFANFFRAGAGGISATVSYAKPLLLRALAYSVLACIALLSCAGIVPHILGAEYARTVEALRWLAVLPVLKVVHYFFSNVLTGSGHQALRTRIQVAVAVFNILINLWLIPAYSWRGAAWSSIASDGLLACGIGLAVFVLCRRSQSVLENVTADAATN